LERKKIDEIDESFFGEEIVEEESSRLKKASPKVVKTKSKTVKKATKKKEIKVDADVEAIKAEILKDVKEDSITIIPEEKTKPVSEKKAEIKPEVKVEAVEAVKTENKPVEPWDEEPSASDEDSLFSKASTWKAIAGVLVLLLLFSAFSGGSSTGALVAGDGIGLKLAEQKALDYVNTELLQAPFTAELKGSEELDNLYRLQFSVAGQDVDSYLTKDGELFFPQGFNLDGSVVALPEETNLDVGDTSTVSIEGDAVLGDVNAPVTIVEFSDFQCAFCKRAHPVLKEIEEAYVASGKVKIVYKDFPLESIHPEAKPAALAAECANEQGRFWEYHDILFDRQAELSKESYFTWAEELGLDLNQFTQCIESEKYSAEVDADFAEGSSLGVTGTPAFFVNGKMINGAQPFEVFEEEIEAILAAIENADAQGVVPEAPAEVVPVVVSEPVAVTLQAKRWLFSPRIVSVGQGDSIELTIIPDGLDFTFAIPDLGIEKEVIGTSTISFTAESSGNFEMTCNSCESWRGMTGTLIVE